ncbi:MAG: FtsX-like permease family protein, partial [Gemmatimonadota bacterium]|nr:FtsX-like permease family protein [Gemmatimonadota bacterium]
LLTGLAYQVVGVTPPGFRDPMGVSSGVDIGVWRTPGFNAPDGFRSGRSWVGFGRLAGGTTLDRSASELTTLGEDLAAEWPEENTDRGFRPVPIRVWLTGPVRTTVLTLAGSVLVILLVACANIANLLLARALQKQRELAVRVALGASGGRLLRASMAEALVLSAAGGIVGAALAFAGLDAVVALAGGWIPQLEDASVDGRMLGFAALAAAVTGLTFGTIPGLRARSAAAAGWARGGGDGQGESRLRRGLVVLEVASAVVLLFGAGLFVRTFVALQQEELGIDTEGLVSMEMSDAGWVDLNEEAGAARWDEILAAVGAVPGVSAVGAIDIVPLEDSYSCDGTRRLDLPPPGPGEGMCTEVRAFLPGAFEAMGIGLVDGRRPDGRDRALGERSVWLSEEAVERLWPERGVRPLGSRLQIHSEEFVVAGIVTDVRHFGPARPVQPMVYLPAHQEPWNGVSRGLALVASIDGSVGDAIGRIRSAVSAAAPGVPVGDVRSGAQLAAGRVAAPRFRLALAVGFATATLVIALVGLGGLTSFSVSRRRREIGVRKALGARSHEIRRMVLLESFGLLGLGLLLGVAAALPLGFALSRFLHSVRPWDPVTLAGVALFMAVAVAAASYPSALRAAREDPADALRTGESSA